MKSILARVASWEFKPDQRKSGFELLENSVLELVQGMEGFRGSFILLSRDDANLDIIWKSEKLEKSFADGVSKIATQKLAPFVTDPPKAAHPIKRRLENSVSCINLTQQKSLSPKKYWRPWAATLLLFHKCPRSSEPTCGALISKN